MFSHLKCQNHQGQAIEYFYLNKNLQNMLWCHKCLQESKDINNENVRKITDFIQYSKQQQFVIENIQNIIENLIFEILEKSEKITTAIKQKYFLDPQQIKSLDYKQTNDYLKQLIAVNDLRNNNLKLIEIKKVELLTLLDNFYQELKMKECFYVQAQQEDIIQSQQLFQQGIKEILQENKEKGLNLLQEALVINPKNIDCLHFLGENSSKEKKFDEALQYFEKILNLEEGNINALNGKAEVYRQQQKFQDAQLLYTTVLNINPNNLDSKLGNAFCCLYNQPRDPEKARQQFQQIVDQNPNNPKALFGVGDSLRLQGKDDQAIIQFRRALNIDPKNVESLSAMGDCYRLKREFTNAERCFNETLQLQPEHVQTLERFGFQNIRISGDSYRMQKKFQLAITYYKKVLELNPNNEWANQQIKNCQRGG